MSLCTELHKILEPLPRFSFPFNEKIISLNGIYVLFEKGETGHINNRIVRIGTHTGDNQLRSRLKQHFAIENKDRSIFRKNIGRCLLNKNKDTYLKAWEIDFTTKQAREKYSHLLDVNHQKSIEKEISNYIQENFTFCILPINDKKKRLEIESKLISTVSNCSDCKPSLRWFGLYSPKDKIKSGGLWLVNSLQSVPLNLTDIEYIKSII